MEYMLCVHPYSFAAILVVQNAFSSRALQKTLKGGTNEKEPMVYLTRKTTRGQHYYYLVKSFKYDGRVEKVQHT